MIKALRILGLATVVSAGFLLPAGTAHAAQPDCVTYTNGGQTVFGRCDPPARVGFRSWRIMVTCRDGTLVRGTLVPIDESTFVSCKVGDTPKNWFTVRYA